MTALEGNQRKGRKLAMTAYEELLKAEAQTDIDTIEIREKSSGKVGVADTCRDGRVAVYYGAEDGSDDAVISPEEFSARFEITAVITGKNWVAKR